MTVIVCRDGVMAADSAVWQGSIIAGHTEKIHRLRDGRLFGGAGQRPSLLACRQWLNGEAEKPADEEVGMFGAILLGPGALHKIDHCFRIYDAAATWAVEGAHSEFLLGALMAGASAEEAVRLAIIVGDSAGGDVQVERL